MWYTHIYLSTYVASIAFAIGAIFFRHLQLIAKLILLLVLANVAIDIYATYKIIVLGIQTHALYNIFIIFEFIYILLIFSIIYPQKKQKYIFYILCFVFALFALLNLIFIKKTTEFNPYIFALGVLLICVSSYIHLRQLIIIDNTNTDNIMLWFSIGNIIFYSAATPILMLSPIINNISENLAGNLFKAKDGAYIIWSTLIAAGFLCQKKKII